MPTLDQMNDYINGGFERLQMAYDVGNSFADDLRDTILEVQSIDETDPDDIRQAVVDTLSENVSDAIIVLNRQVNALWALMQNVHGFDTKHVQGIAHSAIRQLMPMKVRNWREAQANANINAVDAWTDAWEGIWDASKQEWRVYTNPYSRAIADLEEFVDAHGL